MEAGIAFMHALNCAPKSPVLHQHHQDVRLAVLAGDAETRSALPPLAREQGVDAASPVVADVAGQRLRGARRGATRSVRVCVALEQQLHDARVAHLARHLERRAAARAARVDELDEVSTEVEAKQVLERLQLAAPAGGVNRRRHVFDVVRGLEALAAALTRVRTARQLQFVLGLRLQERHLLLLALFVARRLAVVAAGGAVFDRGGCSARAQDGAGTRAGAEAARRRRERHGLGRRAEGLAQLDGLLLEGHAVALARQLCSARRVQHAGGRLEVAHGAPQFRLGGLRREAVARHELELHAEVSHA